MDGDSGTLSPGGTGTITTGKGATFSVAPGATVTTDSCCGTKDLLVNDGTLQVTARPSGVPKGTPATIGPVPFGNSGAINVAGGQKLVLTASPATFNSGTSVTGPGGSTVIQDQVTAAGTLSVGSGTWTRTGRSTAT